MKMAGDLYDDRPALPNLTGFILLKKLLQNWLITIVKIFYKLKV